MARLKKETPEEIFGVKRGWGKEVWIENRPEDLPYCGKLLLLDAGKSCSMHFHMKKTETMYLQSGHVSIHMIDPENGEQYSLNLLPGDKVLIPAGQLHQIEALVDSELFEFSTPHFEEDSYRAWKGD